MTARKSKKQKRFVQFVSRIISILSWSWPKTLYLVFLGLFFLKYPGQNIYLRPVIEAGEPLLRPLPFELEEAASYPVSANKTTPGQEITATSVVVLDADSNTILYERNGNTQLAPASTTKVLTALVALDLYSPDDVVIVSTVETEGQVMGLMQGETITVENLLYGLLIHSGNDAAFVLADHHPDGRDAFIRAMNGKARELNMVHSNFTNPAGFDDPKHKVTAHDLGKLAQAALSNRTIAKMVSIPQITVSDTTHTYYHQLQNINELLGAIPGVAGIKTGWTTQAGENLITLVTREGHNIIIVLLHSENRFEETQSLISWVFDTFNWVDYSQLLQESLAGSPTQD